MTLPAAALHSEPRPQTGVYGLFDVADVTETVDLGHGFFDESFFPEFTSYDPEAFDATLRYGLGNGVLHGVTLRQPELAGFLLFSVSKDYTTDPIALQFLFYVRPDLRKSPAGRGLLNMATASAKSMGAKVFFGGDTAGIPSVTGTIKNLFERSGFDPCYVGRKTL